MSVACRALRFPGVAALIERDRLSPLRVAALFAVAASERATKDGATVILAGATARFNQDREGFNGELERELALWLLDGSSFDEANREAVKIVQKHWQEIRKARGPILLPQLHIATLVPTRTAVTAHAIRQSTPDKK